MAISQTEKEMGMAIEEFMKFDDGKARQISELKKSWSVAPIYLIGKGSSQIFPATQAKNRAKLLLPHHRIEVERPELAHGKYFRYGSFTFLCSNSGDTIEIMQLAYELANRDVQFYGITAEKESPLAEICQDRVYFLQQPPEKATAATKSVIEQALFYDAFMHHLSHDKFYLGAGKELTKRVAEQMQANLGIEVPQHMLEKIVHAKMIYWIDHNTGVCEELALKTKEIAGMPSQYIAGTDILDGHAAAIKKDEETKKTDVIIVGSQYSPKDINNLKAMADSREADIFSLEKQRGFKSLGAHTTKGYEGYSRITAGWKLLLDVAKANGKDPDEAQHIQKSRLI